MYRFIHKVNASIGALAFLLCLKNFALAQDVKPHVDTSGVNMQPVYPASAAASKERGTVVLDVSVNDQGTVDKIRLHQTSGFDDLDSSAIAAVMGWKFKPAVKDGKSVDGVTSLAIAFQPPDDSNGSATPPPANAKAPAGFLPPTVAFDEKRGDDDARTWPVPCANGWVRAQLEFGRANGNREAQWAPIMSIAIESTTESIDLGLWGDQRYNVPQQAFELRKFENSGTVEKPSYQMVSKLNYSFLMPFGTPVVATVSWDATGLVTGSIAVTGMESHHFRLSALPSSFQLSASSAVATFHNPELVCTPAAPKL